MMLNSFDLSLHEYGELPKDGLSFKNIAAIELVIDGKSVLNQSEFNNAFIYYDELERSLHGDGRYLIFTCACGIADDGGWEGVLVNYFDNSVRWEIIGLDKVFLFDLKTYIANILEVKRRIALKPDRVVLQPEQVVFPEDWR